jgi:hypothetical protein
MIQKNATRLAINAKTIKENPVICSALFNPLVISPGLTEPDWQTAWGFGDLLFRASGKPSS